MTSRYPVVLLRVGAFAGSAGPVRYTSRMLARSVPTWENKSVTSGHPRGPDGRFVSVDHSVQVFNAYHVGRLGDVAFDGAALRGVANVERPLLGRLNPLLLARLDAGEVANVSTGLHLMSDGSVRGDHVALLGREPGACSVDHGCGVGGQPLVGNAASLRTGDGLGPLPVPSIGFTWSGGWET
jgi:hypothetical protein